MSRWNDVLDSADWRRQDHQFMAFGLRQAIHNGMERIIYVIPYTSIIEQTQTVFERVFGENNVVAHSPYDANAIQIPITSDTDNLALGILDVTRDTGARTFQFDERFQDKGIEDFYLKFNVALDADGVAPGDNIVVSFPIAGGMADFNITVADEDKDAPTLKKTGVLSTDVSASGNTEILWTVTVTNETDSYKKISIHDTWSDNQEYVDGSFSVGGVATTTGLTVTETGFEYEDTGITSGRIDTIYDNGLSMKEVVLYDRLSPGFSVKDNKATITIGNTDYVVWDFLVILIRRITITTAIPTSPIILRIRLEMSATWLSSNIPRSLPIPNPITLPPMSRPTVFTITRRF